MTYPTLEQVENADRTQLARWYRFLPSPGRLAIGTSDFQAVMDREVAAMKRITDRFVAMGGFTPEISKAIRWEG